MNAIHINGYRFALYFLLVSVLFGNTLLVAQEQFVRMIDNEFTSGVAGSIGIEGQAAENITGYTLAVSFNPSAPISNLGMDVTNTLADDLGVDFVATQIDPIAGTLVMGVLLIDPTQWQVIPPVGFPLLLAEVTFDIDSGIPDQDIPFQFTDGVGSPPSNNIFVIDFASIPVVNQIHGIVAVRTPPPLVDFLRGDANSDSLIDLGDAIFLLSYTFSGGANPDCMDAADVNDDATIDIGDSLHILSYVYASGPPPSAPFPVPGQDLWPDDLPDCI